MPRSSRDLAAALLGRARDDATLVRKVLPDTDVSDSIIGFHAQQAVEKAIKAVLVVSEVRFQRTHALGYLLGLLETNAIAGPPELEDAAALTPWAVEFRYDTEGEALLDRPGALAIIETVLGWASRFVADN